MARATVEEAKTKTEVVVVEPAVYTLVLSEEEAGALGALMGNATSERYCKNNRPFSSIYSALKSVLPKETWQYGSIKRHDGNIEFVPQGE